MQTTITNKFGKLTGWNDFRFTLHGRTFEGISKVDYDDNISVEEVYGGGGYLVGYEVGNYKAKGAISILSEEVIALQAILPSGVRLQELEGTAIATYDYNGLIVVDVLNTVKLKNVEKKNQQGKGSMYMDFELFIGTIDWFKKP